MSAANTYCYAPQRRAVVAFLEDIGAIISNRSPHAVDDVDQLKGLDHINFFVVAGHLDPIPTQMRYMLRERGAVVLEINDAHAREKLTRTHRLLVRDA